MVIIYVIHCLLTSNLYLQQKSQSMYVFLSRIHRSKECTHVRIRCNVIMYNLVLTVGKCDVYLHSHKIQLCLLIAVVAQPFEAPQNDVSLNT